MQVYNYELEFDNKHESQLIRSQGKPDETAIISAEKKISSGSCRWQRQQPGKEKRKGGYFCLKAEEATALFLPGKEKDRNLPDKRKKRLNLPIWESR